MHLEIGKGVCLLSVIGLSIIVITFTICHFYPPPPPLLHHHYRHRQHNIFLFSVRCLKTSFQEIFSSSQVTRESINHLRISMETI